MIAYVEGDLLYSPHLVIAHGCNCFCTMGAGIAKQIARKYPQVLEADKQTKRGDPAKLGTFSKSVVPYRDIYNLYTQFTYGVGENHLDLDALERSLTAMLIDVEATEKKLELERGDFDIAIPMIGCGLAGGNWNDVEAILQRVFRDRTIFVYTRSLLDVVKARNPNVSECS